MVESSKILSVAMVLGTLAGLGAAAAADLPARTYSKAPAMVAEPVNSWTGFYIGANGGYGWKDPTVSYTPNDPAALLGTCSGVGRSTCIPPASFNAQGGLAGGQIGYNWQFNPSWLVGVETDFDGPGLAARERQASFSAAMDPVYLPRLKRSGR